MNCIQSFNHNRALINYLGALLTGGLQTQLNSVRQKVVHKIIVILLSVVEPENGGVHTPHMHGKAYWLIQPDY